jgi:hypothetical protein
LTCTIDKGARGPSTLLPRALLEVENWPGAVRDDTILGGGRYSRSHLGSGFPLGGDHEDKDNVPAKVGKPLGVALPSPAPATSLSRMTLAGTSQGTTIDIDTLS